MTEQKFLAFVRVRDSGVTNMWDAQRVVQLSGGELTDEDDVVDIISNFDEYAQKYLSQDETSR